MPLLRNLATPVFTLLRHVVLSILHSAVFHNLYSSPIQQLRFPENEWFDYSSSSHRANEKRSFIAWNKIGCLYGLLADTGLRLGVYDEGVLSRV